MDAELTQDQIVLLLSILGSRTISCREPDVVCFAGGFDTNLHPSLMGVRKILGGQEVIDLVQIGGIVHAQDFLDLSLGVGGPGVLEQ